MADTTDNNPTKVSDADREMLATMRSHLQGTISTLSETRERELEDLKFYAADSDNNWQWPQDVMSDRVSGDKSARPTLTVNYLPQHVRQVTNDQRQNRPAGRVIPANDGAHEDVAEVFEGLVRHIEYASNADVAYDKMSENQVICGEGYYRIVTEYEDEKSFDQIIKIVPINSIFNVYLDLLCQDPCGEGAKWGIIADDMALDDYERQYPKASRASSLKTLGVGDDSLRAWLTEKTIRVVEYFYVDEQTATLNLYPDNQTAFDGDDDDKRLKAVHKEALSSRQSTRKTIKWVKTNGFEVLERRDWPGDHIPIIRAIGNEFRIEGCIYYSGLVRNAKDAQRMINYWASQEAEMLALAPKAPFIGYEGQFEGHEDEWRTANTKAHPYLQVRAIIDDQSGQVLPLPQRAAPPMAQVGIMQAKQGALADLQATMGQYGASLGQTSNERTGKAIMARQREGDVGTYHFVDNLSRAVRFGTRQIVNLIPKIYDTKRVARIMGEDGTSKTVKFDPSQQQPVQKTVDPMGVIETIYNPTTGKYDACVVTGPSYATKRQEALDAMSDILKGNPELWKVAGDLFVKEMDWPGAQKLAERLAKGIPPEILAAGDDDPALMAAQKQVQQLSMQLDHAHQMLLNVQHSFEAREVVVKETKVKIEQYEAETRRIAALEQTKNPQLTEEQVQEIALGTLHAAIHSGDLLGNAPPVSVPTQQQLPGVNMGDQMPGGPPPDPAAPAQSPAPPAGGQ